MPPTNIAVIGAGFIAEVHLESYRRFVPDARVVAVCSRTREHAEAMAARHHGAATSSPTSQTLPVTGDCEIVDICVPNFLHAEMCRGGRRGGEACDLREAAGGDLEEADPMIAAVPEAGVKLMYAEEFCFRRGTCGSRQVVEEGAFGRSTCRAGREAHRAPQPGSRTSTAGGGVPMDMGCHASSGSAGSSAARRRRCASTRT